MSLVALPAPTADHSVDSARADTADSFEELFRVYAPRVRALAERRLPGRHCADDVVQETFLRAYRSFGGIDPDRPVWPWLRTVATNVCVDMLRQRRNPDRDTAMPDGDDFGLIDAKNDPGELHLAAQRRRSIATALASVNPRQRRVVVLKDIEGWDTEEVAQLEGISVDAVKSTLKRGRQTFRTTYLALADRHGLLAGFGLAVGAFGTRLRRLAARLRPADTGLAAQVSNLLPLAIVASLAGGVVAVNQMFDRGGAHETHQLSSADASLVVEGTTVAASLGDTVHTRAAVTPPTPAGGGVASQSRVVAPLGNGDVLAKAAYARTPERVLLETEASIRLDVLGLPPIEYTGNDTIYCEGSEVRDQLCDTADAVWAAVPGGDGSAPGE